MLTVHVVMETDLLQRVTGENERNYVGSFFLFLFLALFETEKE